MKKVFALGVVAVLAACSSFGTTDSAPDDSGVTGTGGEGGATEGGTDAGAGHLVAFVTTSQYRAPLNGLEADAYCRADAAGRLPGRFVAWIPDGTTQAVARLLTQSGAPVDGPWYRVDGKLLAKSRAALVSTATTPFASPMAITSADASTATGVFTYTHADGGIGTACPASPPTIGVGGMSDSRWTDSNAFTASCQGTLALYCFQVE